MRYRIKTTRRSTDPKWVLLLTLLLALLLLMASGEGEGLGFPFADTDREDAPAVAGSADTPAGDALAGDAPAGDAPAVTVAVRRSATGIVEEMALDDYILGVVAAEMPQTFGDEALKAQAVVARTYTLVKMESGGEGDADVCDDFRHCQAFYDPEALRAEWGADFEERYRRLKDLVAATKGQLLTYEGEPARTYYHSTCGGMTASSLEVWGEDLPYLRPVACHWDQDAPRYREKVTFSLEEMASKLEAAAVEPVAATDDVTAAPVMAGVTDSGRVAAVSFRGERYDATDFRAALALNSTAFSLSVDGEEVTVTTSGFGHGVGLCQYGAAGMAAAGYDYTAILAHFFPGTKISEKRY